MYKIIGSPQSRAFRVIWMMEELELDYQLVPVRPRSKEILDVNPSGKVPALVMDDDVLVDSVAIIQYLADVHDRFTFKTGTIERATQDSFLHFANDEMDAICWTVGKHSFVFPEDKRVADVIPSCKWDWDRSMQTLAERLEGDAWIMGEEFTVPDLVIGHVAGWAKSIGFDWPQGKITDYFNRIRKRPAFLRAMKIRKQS